MVATMPLLMLSGGLMAMVMSRMSGQGQEAYAEAGTTVEQVVSSIRTVRNQLCGRVFWFDECSESKHCHLNCKTPLPLLIDKLHCVVCCVGAIIHWGKKICY